MSLTSVTPFAVSENDEANDDDINQPLLSSNRIPNTIINIKSHIIDNKQNHTKKKLIQLDNRRIIHRDKWRRFHFGILFVFLSCVLYLCFSVNLNIDKRSPQIIVNIPPIDETLSGPRGILKSLIFITFFS